MKKADQILFESLLDLCFPNKLCTSLRNAYRKLLEIDDRSEVPINKLCKSKLQEHIRACLPFQSIHLYTNTPINTMITQEDLDDWLSQSPPVLDDVREHLSKLPEAQYQDLKRHFLCLMEKPNAPIARRWDALVKTVVEDLPYRELSAKFPKLYGNSEPFQKGFCRFLVAWLLLQELRETSKALL